MNPSVTKGTRSDLKKLDKSGLSHINFWATPEGPNSAGTAPVLFFAECSNGEEDGECFPVLASSIGAGRLSALDFSSYFPLVELLEVEMLL